MKEEVGHGSVVAVFVDAHAVHQKVADGTTLVELQLERDWMGAGMQEGAW